MVRNGDYVSDGAGGFLRAEGTDELLQRVLWKLSIPRGSFPLLPALGSELYRLGRAKPAERAGLARQYVAQALSDEAECLGHILPGQSGPLSGLGPAEPVELTTQRRQQRKAPPRDGQLPQHPLQQLIRPFRPQEATRAVADVVAVPHH